MSTNQPIGTSSQTPTKSSVIIKNDKTKINVKQESGIEDPEISAIKNISKSGQKKVTIQIKNESTSQIIQQITSLTDDKISR